MVLRLEPTARWFNLQDRGARWTAVGIAAYLGIIAVVSAISLYTPFVIHTCMFKRLTGRPCSGCGSTRMVFKVLEGKPVEAFLLNPFMFVVILVGLNLLLLKVLWGKKVVVTSHNGLRIAMGVAVLIAFFANWVYVFNAGI